MGKTARIALTVLMVFVLVSGLLTGCGQKNGSGQAAPEPEAVAEEQTETAEDRAEAAEEQTETPEDQAAVSEKEAPAQAAAEEGSETEPEAETETAPGEPDADQEPSGEVPEPSAGEAADKYEEAATEPSGNSGKGTFEEKTGDPTEEKTGDLTEEKTGGALTVEKKGRYTSKDEVALYIHTYGRLPSNFISKRKAEERGWVSSKGNLDKVLPGMSIGGSRYNNYEGVLPDGDYRECDINYSGGFRGPERLVYSEDGRIYYTADHYKTFEQLY